MSYKTAGSTRRPQLLDLLVEEILHVVPVGAGCMRPGVSPRPAHLHDRRKQHRQFPYHAELAGQTHPSYWCWQIQWTPTLHRWSDAPGPIAFHGNMQVNDATLQTSVGSTSHLRLRRQRSFLEFYSAVIHGKRPRMKMPDRRPTQRTNAGRNQPDLRSAQALPQVPPGTHRIVLVNNPSDLRKLRFARKGRRYVGARTGIFR